MYFLIPCIDKNIGGWIDLSSTIQQARCKRFGMTKSEQIFLGEQEKNGDGDLPNPGQALLTNISKGTGVYLSNIH